MPIDQIKRREFITLLGGMRGGCVAARGARAATGKIAPYWRVGDCVASASVR
jgi:hypothetical protein